MRQRWHKNTGFTIIELMITITIIGIISAFAYPAMQRQIAEMKIKNAANQLENGLKQARADAIVYRSPVVVTTTATGINFTQAGNTATNANYPKSLTFDKNIVSRNGININLTATKAAENAPANMSFCYRDVATDEYEVTVDPNSNISTHKAGSCTP